MSQLVQSNKSTKLNTMSNKMQQSMFMMNHHNDFTMDGPRRSVADSYANNMKSVRLSPIIKNTYDISNKLNTNVNRSPYEKSIKFDKLSRKSVDFGFDKGDSSGPKGRFRFLENHKYVPGIMLQH